MKNKLIVLSVIFVVLISIMVYGSGNTKTLKCSAIGSRDGGTTTSDLEVKIKNNVVKDMTLTLQVEIPEDQQEYKQAMIYQMRQKTDQVSTTENGIKAVFGMDSSYFNTFGITKDASYSELKQVLELQGFTCKE